MLEQLESVRKQFLADLEAFPKNPKDIDELRSKYLGRKGKVAALFALMGQAAPEERPTLGKDLNILKQDLTNQFDEKVASKLQLSKVQKMNPLISLCQEKHQELGLSIFLSKRSQRLKIYSNLSVSTWPTAQKWKTNFIILLL